MSPSRFRLCSQNMSEQVASCAEFYHQVRLENLIESDYVLVVDLM